SRRSRDGADESDRDGRPCACAPRRQIRTARGGRQALGSAPSAEPLRPLALEASEVAPVAELARLDRAASARAEERRLARRDPPFPRERARQLEGARRRA